MLEGVLFVRCARSRSSVDVGSLLKERVDRLRDSCHPLQDVIAFRQGELCAEALHKLVWMPAQAHSAVSGSSLRHRIVTAVNAQRSCVQPRPRYICLLPEVGSRSL